MQLFMENRYEGLDAHQPPADPLSHPRTSVSKDTSKVRLLCLRALRSAALLLSREISPSIFARIRSSSAAECVAVVPRRSGSRHGRTEALAIVARATDDEDESSKRVGLDNLRETGLSCPCVEAG